MIGYAECPKISQVKKRAFLAAFSRCGSLSQQQSEPKLTGEVPTIGSKATLGTSKLSGKR